MHNHLNNNFNKKYLLSLIKKLIYHQNSLYPRQESVDIRVDTIVVLK